MAYALKRLKLTYHFSRFIRFHITHSKEHWSQRNKGVATKIALDYFDDFYKSVYENKWEEIRTALLQERSKFIAVVNNFSDTERTCEELEALGAIDIRSIYNVQKEMIIENKLYNNNDETEEKCENKEKIIRNNMDEKIISFISNKQSSELSSICANESTHMKSVTNLIEDNEEFAAFKQPEPLKPVKLKSIESELEIEYDTSRIISASSGLSISSLHEYIPATKIKGLENWVLESEHYDYYTKGSEFEVTIEKENSLSIPQHLKLYTFEESNETRFKSAKRGSTGVNDYYLLDGGSVLPVLALDLQPQDRILDMCAAPGGKSFVAIQTLCPTLIVMNDVRKKRVDRINEVVDQCLSSLEQWQGNLIITQNDARIIDDNSFFNKILVDVPCTNDRHSLHVEDGNWFKSMYIKERIKLPELQSDILTNALKIVTVGGTVVYATCSLSPVQNEGVVQMALKKAYEEANVVMVIKDISEGLKPLECLYDFGEHNLKYGHIVLPTMRNNWGPMYFCKMTKIR